jgi:hypothetical protein
MYLPEISPPPGLMAIKNGAFGKLTKRPVLAFSTRHLVINRSIPAKPRRASRRNKTALFTFRPPVPDGSRACQQPSAPSNPPPRPGSAAALGLRPRPTGAFLGTQGGPLWVQRRRCCAHFSPSRQAYQPPQGFAPPPLLPHCAAQPKNASRQAFPRLTEKPTTRHLTRLTNKNAPGCRFYRFQGRCSANCRTEKLVISQRHNHAIRAEFRPGSRQPHQVP